jgi:hypothetical protein
VPHRFAASEPISAASAPAASLPACIALFPVQQVVDLSGPAAAAAAALQAKLDSTFVVLTCPPFVIAGNLSREQLGGYAQDSIVGPAQAMYASFFDTRPDKVITVLLLADANTYHDWAQRLFGDANIPYYGYYRHAQRTLVMNIATGSGTLVHELTHALIAFDWPEVPLWFNEGLASLHEQCQVAGDRLIGLPNWRLPALPAAIRRGRLAGLEKLPAADFYGPDRGLNYAQARYFCQYLQDRGLLRDFYRQYRASAAKKQTLEQVIQSVCGCGLDRVDQDMRRWVLTLKWP